MTTYRTSSILLLFAECLLLLATGCRRPEPQSSPELILKYSNAACVQSQGDQWNNAIKLTDGSTATISGQRNRPSYIGVTFGGGTKVIAANAGDYVYPSDVRVSPDATRLYVKARGLAGGIWPATVLFEYDLMARRLLQRTDAAKSHLPTECP